MAKTVMQPDLTGSLTAYHPENKQPNIDFFDIFRQLLIPIIVLIFTAGSLYFQFNYISTTISDHSQRLISSENSQSEIKSDQRVFNANLQTINESQKIMSLDIKSISENVTQIKQDVELLKERTKKR